MNAALALTAAVVHFDVRSAARSRGLAARRGRVGPVLHRAASPTGATARVLLAKNPAGWTEVLRWLARHASRASCSRSTRTSPTAATRRGSGTCRTSCCAACRSPPAASARLDVAVRLDYGGVEHFVEPDPLAAAARLPGDEVDIIASYTQFTHLTRGRSW